jgi:hypothetical protein
MAKASTTASTVGLLNSVVDMLESRGLIRMLAPGEEAPPDYEEWTTGCLDQQEVIDRLVEQTNG